MEDPAMDIGSPQAGPRGDPPPAAPPAALALGVVGVSEMRLSADRDETLVTYSLGSCLGVAVFDPVAGVGGLIHCMLPSSRLDPVKAAASPCTFVDTGVPALLQAVFDRGATRKRLIVKVAGGASPLDSAGRFEIGHRNYVMLRKVLWKNNLLIAGEHMGGREPRSVYLAMRDGATYVRIRGRKILL